MGAKVDGYYLQGQQGGVILEANNLSATGDFRWIQFLADTEIDAILSTNLTDIGALDGVTIGAGIGIGGHFTSVAIVSGLVIAYYA